MEKTKEEELCPMIEMVNEFRIRMGDMLGIHGIGGETCAPLAFIEAAAERVQKDNVHLNSELEETRSNLKEARRVQKEFIGDCAALLGLPELDENTEYVGEAIRKGIARLRQALEKVNDIRNDIVGRQTMGWSAHIYPLVAALDNAGFKGMEYTEAREKIEATMGAARELAAQAWCSETTEQTEMDVVLAEEFAEILFPFLEALEFYGKLGNWQGMKDGEMECVCDREMGARARATLGRPDREVPGDEDEE